MVKNIVVVSILLFFNNSCNLSKQNNERDVFLGIKLGSSIRQVQSKLFELAELGQLKTYQKEFGPKAPYYTNTTYDNKTYFSSPIYFYPPGDTIVTELKIVYCESLSTLHETLELGLKEWNFMNLSSYESNLFDRISSKNILNDIITKLDPKYGVYQSRDTMTVYNGFEDIYRWKDKNGVDIELNYYQDFSSPTLSSMYSGNSRIYLRYKYTEEMLKNVTNKNSVY